MRGRGSLSDQRRFPVAPRSPPLESKHSRNREFRPDEPPVPVHRALTGHSRSCLVHLPFTSVYEKGLTRQRLPVALGSYGDPGLGGILWRDSEARARRPSARDRSAHQFAINGMSATAGSSMPTNKEPLG